MLLQSRYETANTTTTIQGQIPTAATSEQPVPSGMYSRFLCRYVDRKYRVA